MRSLICALLLLSLALGVMFFASHHLQRCCDALLDTLEQPPDTLSASVLQEQLDAWEKQIPRLSLVAPRDSLRRIYELLLMLKSCLDQQWTQAARVIHAQLCEALRQLKKDTLPLLEK